MSNNAGGIEMMDVEGKIIIEYLKEMLDKPVLIPIPLGKKGPKFKGWQRTTYETIPWQEIARVIERGGNLGVILGPPSGNLVTVDLDSDDEMKRFFDFAPWAKDTYISRGAKGCQCWFIIEGQYPSKRTIWKTIDKRPVVEFRGGDIQSVTWGRHPDTGERYQTNGKRVKHVSYYDLEEYQNYLQEQCGECDQEIHRDGQQDDFTWTKRYRGCDLKELDLAGMFKEAGIKYRLKSEEGIDKYAIQCPWIKEHSTANGEWDATVHMFEPRGQYWPAFKCLHSHCDHRGLKDLLGWLEEAHGLGPRTVRKYCDRGERGRVIIVDYSDMIEAPPLPDPIIDGLVYPELKMLIASAAKIGKTWMGIDIGLCLASGLNWMEFDTCQSRILYLNLEMPPPWFMKRICDIKKVRGIGKLPKESFEAANLRGSNSLEGNLDALYGVCEERGPYGVIIYDPAYKLLGDLDENKATDVAKLLRMVDAIGRATGSASILIHHYAKGDAWAKKAGDRASGSGVFIRDPDTYMAITEMGDEDSGMARVDLRLRCAPRVSPFGIKWGDYRWQRDPTIDVSKTKKPYTGEDKPKTKAPTVGDKMLQVLKDNPQGMSYTTWKVESVTTRKITTEGGFENNVADLKKKGRVTQKGNLYFAVAEAE